MSGNNEPFMDDPFLNGNEIIEKAIEDLHNEGSKEKLIEVLESIRTRMHADGHLIFPVQIEDDGETFAFRTIQTDDGNFWQVAFTSQKEFEKGAESEVISNFIDTTLKGCLETDITGFIINPWGQSFVLTKDLIEMIFEADGDVEYSVPDDKITAKLLEGGTYLKRAIDICNRNRTRLNMIKLLKILRDSWVWIPCNAIMSDEDYEVLEKAAKETENGKGLESLVGQIFSTCDNVRLVPDILQNGDNYFFPVFTSDEEMGEYGKNFSKIEKHFLEAIILAKNNEKKVTGIVINAFSNPLEIDKELFELVEKMESSLEATDES